MLLDCSYCSILIFAMIACCDPATSWRWTFPPLVLCYTSLISHCFALEIKNFWCLRKVPSKILIADIWTENRFAFTFYLPVASLLHSNQLVRFDLWSRFWNIGVSLFKEEEEGKWNERTGWWWWPAFCIVFLSGKRWPGYKHVWAGCKQQKKSTVFLKHKSCSSFLWPQQPKNTSLFYLQYTQIFIKLTKYISVNIDT